MENEIKKLQEQLKNLHVTNGMLSMQAIVIDWAIANPTAMNATDQTDLFNVMRNAVTVQENKGAKAAEEWRDLKQ
jgi:hypothetical protein